MKDYDVQQIICSTENKTNQKYLLKKGFEQTNISKNIFVKKI